MQVDIDNDFQQKVMTQSFPEATRLATAADVQGWRSQWMKALGSWHSPYKLMLDCGNLTVVGDPETVQALGLMVRFFNGFFLRKAVGFNRKDGQGHELLPFAVHVEADEAAVELGIRQPKVKTPTDFRSQISVASDFQRHVIELSFATPVVVATKEQMAALRTKIMNTLMQWHSKWSLIVDCANLEIDAAVRPDFEKMLVTLKGFHMKRAIGYSPRGAADTYPFEVFRARHRAAGALESEGNQSGDAADCKSKKA